MEILFRQTSHHWQHCVHVMILSTYLPTIQRFKSIKSDLTQHCAHAMILSTYLYLKDKRISFVLSMETLFPQTLHHWQHCVHAMILSTYFPTIQNFKSIKLDHTAKKTCSTFLLKYFSHQHWYEQQRSVSLSLKVCWKFCSDTNTEHYPCF